MEVAKLDWNSFIRRRRLDVPAWLKHHGIKSYKALVEKCEALNMEPPSKDEVKGLFGVKKSKAPAPKVEPKIEPMAEEEPKKKKRGRRPKVDKSSEEA